VAAQVRCGGDTLAQKKRHVVFIDASGPREMAQAKGVLKKTALSGKNRLLSEQDAGSCRRKCAKAKRLDEAQHPSRMYFVQEGKGQWNKREERMGRGSQEKETCATEKKNLKSSISL